VETHEKHKEEFLLLIKDTGYGKQILKKISSLSSEPIPHVAYKIIFQNINTFQTWHDRLGHPDIGMMQKIINIPMIMT
jgi:hypothetical protein